MGLVPFLGGGAMELWVLVAKLLGDTFQEHVAAIIIGVLYAMYGGVATPSETSTTRFW